MHEKPDTFEKVVRFICGAVLGLIIGTIEVVAFDVFDPLYFLGIVIITAIICGFLAMIYGDSFWEFLKYWRWWS